MSNRISRVDEYIASAAPFARPILRHVRKLVHKACPDVKETIKWNMPAFEHHGIMLGMAAFKEHCAVGFWKGDLVLGKRAGSDGAMGHFGKVRRLDDLPGDAQFLEYVRKAAQLNRDGVVRPRKLAKKPKSRSLSLPEYFVEALRRNKKAAAVFEQLSYSHRKEYVEWLTEAKRDETRARRLSTALQWLSEGKPRHWQYTGKSYHDA
ncbi:MAG: YdeI/OmpD-associated family protein [Verrucomicrobia bacterium]|nr:YdeI/OmpD-associated family protein [Verrucomicrobiota bacterium]